MDTYKEITQERRLSEEMRDFISNALSNVEDQWVSKKKSTFLTKKISHIPCMYAGACFLFYLYSRYIIALTQARNFQRK